MKLGILGGSFNPIHHGHLIIATRAAEALGLDRVLFIPTALSPLKGTRPLAPARDRLAMVRAAVRGHPLFAASDVETRRGGTSYTIDTLKTLRESHRGRFYLIVGADAANHRAARRAAGRGHHLALDDGRHGNDEVKRLATLVTVARPGHSTGPGMPKHPMVEVPLLEISSSEIRARARRGLSIRYLVPDAVERYIRRKMLYRRG